MKSLYLKCISIGPWLTCSEKVLPLDFPAAYKYSICPFDLPAVYKYWSLNLRGDVGPDSLNEVNDNSGINRGGEVRPLQEMEMFNGPCVISLQHKTI